MNLRRLINSWKRISFDIKIFKLILILIHEKIEFFITIIIIVYIVKELFITSNI